MTVRTYIRVSREDEADILENQRTATREEALRLAAGEPIVYEEIVSGAEPGRSEWNRLLHEVRRGDVVIFTRPSRMTRGGVAAAFTLLSRLRDSGVGWRFTEYPLLNLDSTVPKVVQDIILAVIAALDEDYRVQISRATRAAHERQKNLAAADGRPLTWGKRGPDKRPRKKRAPPRPAWERAPPEEGGRL